MMRPEDKIELDACRWAIENGWSAYKFSSPNRRFVPDRIFIKDGRVVFIEFKAPKGRLAPGQEREIERLKKQKAMVYVCHSAAEATRVLEKTSES